MSHTPMFPYSRLTPEQVRHYAKKLGRELTAAEVLRGHLTRERTAQFGEPWRVRPAAPPEDPYDREVRLAEEKVEDERLGRMSPAERALALVQKARAKRDADAKALVDHEAKLKVFKPHIEQLDKLIEHVRFDESYTCEQVEALFNAKQQMTSTGACPVYAEQLFVACLATAREQIDARLQAANAARDGEAYRQAQRDKELAEFTAVIGLEDLEQDEATQKRTARKATEDVYDAKWTELANVMRTKLAAYNATPKDAPREVRDAAYAEWQAANLAIRSHSDSRAELLAANTSEAAS